MKNKDLKVFLDKKVDYFNRPTFIEHDPICIPHRFSKKQDIEIAGFFAAIFAWGNRTTIINKATDLLQRMDNAPYAFVQHHSPNDLKNLLGFKHRTFMDSDLLFLVDFFKQHYKQHNTLEIAFLPNQAQSTQQEKLEHFYNYIFSFDHLRRTEKHISTPAKNSACKRINMYLRWMVRQDTSQVDFGIWKKMKPSELMIPLDVHVGRVAKNLGLMNNEKSNWKETVKLTNKLRQFDPADPIKYDFALFGMGIASK